MAGKVTERMLVAGGGALIEALRDTGVAFTPKASSGQLNYILRHTYTLMRRAEEAVQRFSEPGKSHPHVLPEKDVNEVRPAERRVNFEPYCGVARSELTARERTVLFWVALDYSNKEIADKLGIAMPTAKNHVQRILHIYKVKSRIGAVCVGLIRGDISVEDLKKAYGDGRDN